MDFDIGTIFYIIITIVAIVAGARGKKKKPVNQPAEKGNAESKLEGFLTKMGVQLEGLVDDSKTTTDPYKEEFIRSQSDSEADFEPEEESYDQYVEEELEKRQFSEYEGEYDPDSLDNLDLILAEARRTTTDTEIQDVIDLDDISDQDYSDLVKDFDLQTAVIYSSILDRVEY